MDGARAVFFQGGEVLGCGVAEVLVESIFGKFQGHFTHQAVALGFGEDRSSGNAGVNGVAVDDGFGPGLEAEGDLIAVDQDSPFPAVERKDGGFHGVEGGMEDVAPDDRIQACFDDPVFGSGFDALGHRLPPLAVDDLGVVDALQVETFGKPHRRHHHRPGQRTSSSLVDPDGPGNMGERLTGQLSAPNSSEYRTRNSCPKARLGGGPQELQEMQRNVCGKDSIAYDAVNRMRPPSKFEFDLLAFLANHNGLTVREIYDQFGRGRDYVRGTIVKAMDRLHRKGLVSREPSELGFRYRTQQGADEMDRQLVESFVRDRFGGRIKPIANFLAETDALDAEEIEQLRAMLNELEK